MKHFKEAFMKTSPLPNEGHKFEQTRNEFCETACMRAKRVVEGVGERGLNSCHSEGFSKIQDSPKNRLICAMLRRTFAVAQDDKKQQKAAFTLAEVLITLAIIGVVAAMTIPTLWSKIGAKVADNQNKVFQAKFIKALNLAKTAGDIHDKYSSTEDFLRNGLAKHYKMVSICGANNLRDCIPYDTIKYMDGNEEKTVNVANLKTASSIQLDAPFEDTAAFVTADGVPVIISYDKTCTVDTEKLDRSISSCVAGIYDLNGSKLPNKYGFTKDNEGKISSFTNDIRTFNGAGIGSTDLFSFKIVQKMFKPYESAIFTEVGSPQFEDGNDYWKAAELYCASKGGQLPNGAQLAEIATKLYGDSQEISTSDTDYNDNYYDTTWDSAKDAVFEALGVTLSDYGDYFNLWSRTSKYSDDAWGRNFNKSSTLYYYDNGRQNSEYTAICVK